MEKVISISSQVKKVLADSTIDFVDFRYKLLEDMRALIQEDGANFEIFESFACNRKKS